jgi:predicted nucleic acid-binding protein
VKVFADTNFYTNLWLELAHAERANALYAKLLKSGGSLPVTRLVRMELTNALQRLVYESRHGSQDIRVSPEAALAAHEDFDAELIAGDVLVWQALPEDALEATFETLAYRHTASGGFRTYDLLHVAAALVLGCDSFWSFDARACRLAKLAGLKTHN